MLEGVVFLNKTVLGGRFLPLAAGWLICFFGGLQGAEKKAFLAGVSSYENFHELFNTGSDVELIAEKLREVGFETDIAIDSNFSELSERFSVFVSSLEPEDAVIVYFAGHGLQAAGTNYLLASDARVDASGRISFALRLSEILSQLEGKSSSLNAVLLDCCRGWPKGASLPIREGLAPVVNAPRRTIVAFATAANENALDGEGENSPFAEALAVSLQARPASGITVSEALQNAARLVAHRTEHEQSPAIYFDAGAEPVYLVEPTEETGPSTEGGSTMPKPLTPQYVAERAVQPTRGWKKPEDLDPIAAGPILMQMRRGRREGTSFFVDVALRASAAVDFEIKVPDVYDVLGRYYSENRMLYDRDGRTSKYTSYMYFEMKPGAEEFFTIECQNLPADLDGFTTFLISGEIDNKKFQVPLRDIRINENVNLPEPPRSRFQRLGDISYSLTGVERQGSNVVIKLLMESIRDQVIDLERFDAYDEAGFWYWEGNYSIGRRSSNNRYSREVYLPENQPIEVTYTVKKVPAECAGFTLLKLQFEGEGKRFSIPFYDLPLDQTRSRDIGEAIPELVWKLPQTREPEMVDGLAIGFRKATQAGDQATVEVILGSASSHEIEIDRVYAWLEDGTFLDKGSHGVVGTRFVGNSYTYEFVQPAEQPVSYRFLFKEIPPKTKGIATLMLLGDIGRKKFQTRIPAIPFPGAVERGGEGFAAPGDLLMLDKQRQGDIEIQLADARTDSGKLEIVLRIIKFGADSTFNPRGAVLTLPNQTTIENASARLGGESHSFGYWDYILPTDQPTKVTLQFETAVSSNGVLPSLVIRGTENRDEKTYTFRNIPLNTMKDGGEGSRGSSRWERLQQR
ncbi:MAG: hypothetical protein CMO55_06660 [Verrucomicrobiales bacterium]|nr:hypothetical protein [Verrucomicrobiales bacterium]